MAVPANKSKSGRFVKGVSGNPSGRPKNEGLEWTREFAAGEGKERLLLWARSNNPKASLQALTLIFAYGFGKPTEHHDLTSNGKGVIDILLEARGDSPS